MGVCVHSMGVCVVRVSHATLCSIDGAACCQGTLPANGDRTLPRTQALLRSKQSRPMPASRAARALFLILFSVFWHTGQLGTVDCIHTSLGVYIWASHAGGLFNTICTRTTRPWTHHHRLIIIVMIVITITTSTTSHHRH